MSSTKFKINDKKSKPAKNRNNKNDKNKKVIENSKNEIDDIFASAKSKKMSIDSQPHELPSSTSSSSSCSSEIKQKVEEFVFKVPAIPDKSQFTKRKLKLNDDDGFSDSRGTKNR